jgi:hypothetical protein
MISSTPRTVTKVDPVLGPVPASAISTMLCQN